MPASLGGQTCLEPYQELQNCLQAEQPTDWWALRPNGYRCPLGHLSGQGWCLLLRGQLDLLNLDAEHSFTVTAPEHGLSVTHQHLHVVGTACILPGRASDPLAPYLVELADRRRLLRLGGLVNSAFNVRDETGQGFYDSTTGGEPWTWEDMLASLWGLLEPTRAGAWPGLPFEPDGMPEGWAFWGPTHALDAVGLVLSRLGCALKLDTQTSRFSVVQLGLTDDAGEAEQQRAYAARTFDGQPALSAIGRIPARVAVLFPIVRDGPLQYGRSPYYEVVIEGTAEQAEGATGLSIAAIVDDLTAVYDDTDSLTNLGLLTTRAQERADDYYRLLRIEPLHRKWTLPHARIRPGATLDAVEWRDRGLGAVTEGWRDPARPGVPPVVPCPCDQPALGGSETGSGDGPVTCIDVLVDVTIECIDNSIVVTKTYKSLTGVFTISDLACS